MQALTCRQMRAVMQEELPLSGSGVVRFFVSGVCLRLDQSSLVIDDGTGALVQAFFPLPQQQQAHLTFDFSSLQVGTLLDCFLEVSWQAQPQPQLGQIVLASCRVLTDPNFETLRFFELVSAQEKRKRMSLREQCFLTMQEQQQRQQQQQHQQQQQPQQQEQCIGRIGDETITASIVFEIVQRLCESSSGGGAAMQAICEAVKRAPPVILPLLEELQGDCLLYTNGGSYFLL